MPAKRELTMRQIRQILRLVRDGMSAREIGRSLGVARSTIQDNLKRAAGGGARVALAAELTDEVLETAAVCPGGREARLPPAHRSRTGRRWPAS